MTTSLGSCIGIQSPAVSKFREPYGLCCTKNGSMTQINNNYDTNKYFKKQCNNIE